MMSIDVEWLNDQKTILVMKYHDKWVWTDFYAAYATAGERLAEVAHKVYFIHVVESFPQGSVLPHLRSVFQRTPEQVAGSVVVPSSTRVNNSILQAMVNVSAQVFGGSGIMKYATTFDEAVQMLQAQMGTAPPQTPA